MHLNGHDFEQKLSQIEENSGNYEEYTNGTSENFLPGKYLKYEITNGKRTEIWEIKPIRLLTSLKKFSWNQ